MTARMARRRPSHVASRRPISRARDGIFCCGRRSPLVVAPAGADPPRPEALEDELVRCHRQENEDPEDGVLQERAHYWPAQEALLEQVDERRAEKRSHHRARAAEDIHAADHDGRDRLELEPLAGDDGDVPEAHQEKETGEAGESPAEQEGHEDVALDREASNAGGLWIGTDREEPPAIGQVLQDELEHDDQGLADSDDGDDLETGADVGERPSREVVGDLGRKERSDGNEDEHERDLADLLRPDAAEQPCHAVPAGASVCPIAAANTRSWVASALAKTATCRPSRMTRMRSLIARTSGSSELMRTMARPSWASSSMI